MGLFLFKIPISVFFNAKHNAPRGIPQNIGEIMNPQLPACILPVNNVQTGIVPGTFSPISHRIESHVSKNRKSGCAARWSSEVEIGIAFAIGSTD